MSEKGTVGKVVQVIGPVIDAEFAPEALPEIYNALELKWTDDDGTSNRLVCEVAQHIGRNQVRAVAMDATDGVRRGMDVIDTGQAITAPVGEAALGRILNVLGEPVDEMGPVEAKERWPIHRKAPTLEHLEPKTEIFVTGIKVVEAFGARSSGDCPLRSIVLPGDCLVILHTHRGDGFPMGRGFF